MLRYIPGQFLTPQCTLFRFEVWSA